MPARIMSLWLALTLVGLMRGEAPAALITDLYSTGVDNSNNPLPNGSADPHYNLVSVFDVPSTTLITINAPAIVYTVFAPDSPPGSLPSNTAPDSWLGNTATLPDTTTPVSRWIGQQDNSVYANTSGSIFTYQTTFTIASGFTAAAISGYWAADNIGLNIILNGNSTGLTTGFGSMSYTAWTPFTINNPSWFVVGTNVLQFVVQNTSAFASNPEGLRVEIKSASFTPIIPEPTSMALLGTGLVGLAFLRRRNRASAN